MGFKSHPQVGLEGGGVGRPPPTNFLRISEGSPLFARAKRVEDERKGGPFWEMHVSGGGGSAGQKCIMHFWFQGGRPLNAETAEEFSFFLPKRPFPSPPVGD